MSDYERLIEECEALIRSGEDHRVAKHLLKINTAKVPRKWRLPLANIARRSSQIAIGLRLLTSVARPITTEDRPQPRELAEYAILLQRAGSVREATSILESLSPADVPNVLLLRSFCYFNTWNYEKSIPLLEQYLKQPLEQYQMLVARANLGSAYVATGEWQKAESHLTATIELASEASASRLKGNCYELLSQVHLFTDRLSEADTCLAQAESIFESAPGLERLLVDKCRAFYEAKNQNSIEPLIKFQSRARQWPHPETVRETELFLLLTKFDQNRLNQLYYGTPFTSYRSRIDRLVASKPTGDTCLIGEGRSQVLSIDNGKLDNGSEVFASGSIPHQMIACLAADSYRPTSTNGLFAELFSDQYFNIFSSPARVHQVLRRTRQAIEEHKLPITIAKNKSGFYLEVSGGLALELRLNAKPVRTYDQRLDKLRSIFLNKEFSASEARAALDLSRAAAQRFLADAKQANEVDAYGAGPTTVYQFTKKSV